jgi:hypothetical protein
MRYKASGPDGPLLPDAQAEPLAGDGTLGVFAAPRDLDRGRGEPADQQAAFPDSPGRIGEVTDLKLSDLLKKLLDEVADDEFQDRPGSRMLVKEALARMLMERALGGNQFAIEAVLDRVEGKAVRGQQAAQVDNAIEEQIDRAAVASLNSLLTPPPKE